MELGEHSVREAKVSPAGAPALSEDIRSLLAATVLDVCAGGGVSFCSISRVTGDAAVLAAAQGGGPLLAVGTAWRVSDVPPARQALTTRRAVVLAGRDDPRLTLEQRETLTGQAGTVGLAFVPLLTLSGPSGLLVLGDHRPRDLGAEVMRLAPVVRLAARVLEQDERMGELTRSADDLALVLDADIEAQSRAAGPDQALRVVARRLGELCDSPMVDISAVEDEALRPLVRWSYGRFDREGFDPAIPLTQRPLLRALITTGRAEHVASLDDPRLVKSERVAMRSRSAQSALLIPLLSNGRTIGVAEILDNRPRDFVAVERPALALGEIAAHLLDKALLLQTLEQRDISLREIVKLGARVNATSRPEEMAAFVARRLLAVLDARCCEVYLAERESLRLLSSVDRTGGAEDPVSASSPRGLRESPPVISDHEVRVLTAVTDPLLTPEERGIWARSGFASQLSLPLVIDGRLVGLIDVFSPQERGLDGHLDFARGVAQTMASAFDNLQLLARLAESKRQLGVLAESSLEFGASLDVTQVLHSVASRMCLAATAACCDIYAIEGDELHGLVSTDGSVVDDAFPGTTYHLDDFAVARRAIELGRPVVVSDIPGDPRLTPTQHSEDRRGFTNAVELPLIDRGEAVGVATLFGLEDPDVAMTDLLRGLAQLAAQALANARVHAALDDGASRLRQINDAGIELAANLDLERVLETAARRLCAVARVDSCDIYTLEGKALRCVASLVRGDRDTDWLGSRLRLEDWRASRLAVDSRSAVHAATRERAVVDDLHSREPRGTARRGGLIVPLLVEQRVIGVVALCDSAQARAFSDDDVASVEAVSRVAAMAIANAGLYRDAQLRTRESELLNRVASRASSSLDTRTIAAATFEELATLVPHTDACLMMETVPPEWEVVYSTSPALEDLARGRGTALEHVLESLRREHVIALDLTDELPPSAEAPARRLQAALLIGVFFDDALSGALVLGAPGRDAFSGVDHEVLERVGALLALSFKNARLYQTIKTMHVANLKALISALNARDHYAVGHAARVAAYMLLLGRELGWQPGRLQQITEAAFLHDVGRIGISDDVLYKPGRLTDEEAAELRRHPSASAEIVRPLFPQDIVRAVRHHHERWDGGGYPEGLAGENIPQVARALCIVDSYDAMSFQRQHHEALSYAECLSELDHCRGTQFDPEMVTAFMRVLDRLDERRLVARAAAEQAAALVEPAMLVRTGTGGHESGPEYRRLAKMLREVRDANTGVRYLTAIAPELAGWRTVCDPEEDPALRSHPGDLVDRSAITEDAAADAERNVLQLDDFGVWVSSVAEIRDAEGVLAGLACAYLAPADDWPAELGAGGTDHDRTFSAIVESATARLGRARVDAVTDGLTGLYNQRYFKQRLAEEIERAADQGRPLSLLFCDLDRFKGYNDRLGHVAGDKALRAVASVILQSIRQVDLAARYGGEELTVILLDTPGQAAVEVAERIRQGVAGLELGEDRGLTVSIGTAAYPDHATKVEELIDKADWAMYLAKRKGRDRVVSFGQAGDDSPAVTREQKGSG